MIEQMKRIPGVSLAYRVPFLVSLYHITLSFLGALLSGFPSKKLIVIGITGTKGKTTTAHLVHQILTSAGIKAGLATTVRFHDGEEERINDTKQTMLGRFALQRLLARMVKNGCTYAVIETSSEGILQHRHRFIAYRTAVFTNLSPEHIERHGSFEDYRATKIKLFKQVSKRKDGRGVYNLDDPHAEYFLKPRIAHSFGYAIKTKLPYPRFGIERQVQVSNVRLSAIGSQFDMEGTAYEMPLTGEFNVLNAAAAIGVARLEGVAPQVIQAALKSAKAPSGRMEVLEKNGVKIIIDYAHEPASLEAIYNAARLFRPRKLIGLLGSQGGGRDVWKRGAMGKIAAQYCDFIVLTNEDPYDEDPVSIIEDIEKGVRNESDRPQVFKIVNRRAGIEKALALAGKGDVVVLTGKGGEVWMCVAHGERIPWDERKVVEELLE